MLHFIIQLTEAQHRNHQVQTWMKQVVGLTRDCGGNIELYVQYVGGVDSAGGFKGIFRFLWSILRFLRTVSVCHWIVTRIEELKVRAHDVATAAEAGGRGLQGRARIASEVGRAAEVGAGIVASLGCGKGFSSRLP